MPNFPSPSDLFQSYKTILKSLRPDINVDDPSIESVIRGKVLSGILSGVYGDQKKVNDDTYVPDARTEALVRRGADYGLTKQPSTFAHSDTVTLTGTAGSVVNAGTVLSYAPTGLQYQTDSLATIGGGGSVTVSVTCLTAGQLGNVSAGNTLTFVSPPAGVSPTATLTTALANGSEEESNDSFRTRLLNRMQHQASGGNSYDYPNFAFAADPSIRSAFIRRWGRGLGTVDVYVTSGTTDVDSAINQGLSIVRIPSGSVVTAVQNYYNLNAPLNDAAGVFTPTEIAQDVTVKVRLASGLTLTSVFSDSVNNPLGLTVQALIQREISRTLYKVPVGGRVIPGLTVGYVVASDMERQLDNALSAVTGDNGVAIGKMALLMDRQVQALDGVNVNRALATNQLVIPGTLTVTVGV